MIKLCSTCEARISPKSRTGICDACRKREINGDKLDNRIENLELWDRSQPAGQRVEDKIKHAIELLNRWGYKVSK